MNSFKNWQDMVEADLSLPPEIEDRVVAQANTYQHFGKVVELFGTNALQTVISMLGSSDPASGQIDIRRPVHGPNQQTDIARNALQNLR